MTMAGGVRRWRKRGAGGGRAKESVYPFLLAYCKMSAGRIEALRKKAAVSRSKCMSISDRAPTLGAGRVDGLVSPVRPWQDSRRKAQPKL